MALKVQFGNGGAASVADLTNVADQAAYKLLNGGSIDENITDDGPVVPASVINVPVASGVEGSGAGGNVEVSYDADSNAFKFDVTTAWNSVKNVLAQSDTAESLTFSDFVQADVHLGNGGNSTVEIYNAKRGNVTTGDGNDTVIVSLLSNDDGWVNAFKINTGAGNDTIVIEAGESLKSIGGIVGATAVNGGGGITDGSNTAVTINAGAGNDIIDLSSVNLKSSVVTGGTGIDQIIASGGADTFVFNLGDMAKTLATDTIIGFDQSEDKLQLTGTSFDQWKVDHYFGDTVLSYNGPSASHVGEKIIIAGVELSAVTHDWFTA